MRQFKKYNTIVIILLILLFFGCSNNAVIDYQKITINVVGNPTIVDQIKQSIKHNPTSDFQLIIGDEKQTSGNATFKNNLLQSKRLNLTIPIKIIINNQVVFDDELQSQLYLNLNQNDLTNELKTNQAWMQLRQKIIVQILIQINQWYAKKRH